VITPESATGIEPAPGGLAGGRSYPLTFPREYTPVSAAASRRTVNNRGNASAWPALTITGPVTGPAVINERTGQVLTIDATVGPSEVLIVDMRARTAYVDATRVDARAGSSWWPLLPGDNDVQYAPQAHDGTTRLTVEWFPSWF
jgi:hypothetical protein